MPAGILNKNIIVSLNGAGVTQGSITTSEIRDKYLSKNLPDPVPLELRGTEFENYLEQLGSVISLPNPLLSESNQSTFFKKEDGGYDLDTVAEDERIVLINGKNKYVGREEHYYEYSFPAEGDITLPRLEDLYKEYGSALNDIKKSYGNGGFKLISSGEEIGRRDPYNVIRTSDISTKSESGLGIIGLEQLKTSIVKTRGLIEVNQNKEVANQYVDGLTNQSVKSYKITEKSGEDDGVMYTEYLQGAMKTSILPNEAVGWNEYSRPPQQDNVLDILGDLGIPNDTALSTEQRSIKMLELSSDGQKLILYKNFNENKYIPNYQDPRLTQLLGDNTPNSRYYIGDERSTNRGAKVTKVFKSEQFNDGEETPKPTTILNPDEFLWKKEGGEFNNKTLLSKTQDLVNNYSEEVFIDQTAKFFKDKNKDKYVSRGSAITERDEDPTSFFRVWTKENEYSYERAIKKTGLRFKPESPGSSRAGLSVLQENGLPKIAPTPLDKFVDVKKYMLSIENLAWSDNLEELPDCEKGPGDLTSGRRGRIMWFTPYDLQFDENVNANWTTTDFIGRGEPIYTYNNTKRSGQLRFKIIVDHPSIINEYRGRRDKLLERFFSGGRTFEQVLQDFVGLNVIDVNTERLLENKLNSIARKAVTKNNVVNKELSVFFEAAVATKLATPKNDKYVSELSTLGSFFKNSKEISVTLKGFTGSIGKGSVAKQDEKDLANQRMEVIKQDIIDAVEQDGPKLGDDKFKLNAVGSTNKIVEEGDPEGDDGTEATENRRVDIIIRIDPNDAQDIVDEKVNEELEEALSSLNPNISIDECNYFDIIDDTYPNYFDGISEKIKYFQPGFHSTTPESLNSRTTFLHQCMRQGPSVNNSTSQLRPQNLAFGRPPVCILRIGDYMHTKIVINSLSLNYGAGGGGTPQWDLNPEGVGVQPMMVDVNLSIDIVGGQSILGPINRLQNALSFNYYANTEFYDRRSDFIAAKEGGGYQLVDASWPVKSSTKDGIQTNTDDNEKTNGETNQTTAKDGESDLEPTPEDKEGFLSFLKRRGRRT